MKEHRWPSWKVIEITTTHPEQIQGLMDEWVAKTEGRRKTHRTGSGRDRPDTYVQIVEFPSYEEAMDNSRLSETSEFAGKLGKLCDPPPTFRNLDVRRVDDLT